MYNNTMFWQLYKLTLHLLGVLLDWIIYIMQIVDVEILERVYECGDWKGLHIVFIKY